MEGRTVTGAVRILSTPEMPSNMHQRPTIVCIVGKSNSGKTTLIERLIPALRSRGYRLATIKHAGHDFDMDRPGKDSHRHKCAGAEAVMVAGPNRIALFRDVASPRLDELAGYFPDVDLILTEGYKRADQPKIEICRAARSETPLCLGDPSLVALVTDCVAPAADIPVFSLDDVDALADLVEHRFLRRPTLSASAAP